MIKLLKIGAATLIAAVAATPMTVLAELSADRTAEIGNLVDAAISSGDTALLQRVLTTVVVADGADAAAAAQVASQRIAAAIAAHPAASATNGAASASESVTATTIATLVSASPAQAGNVLLAAQAALPANLQIVAVTATQNALSPAAGGKILVNRISCTIHKPGYPCRSWQVPVNMAH